MQQEDVIKKIEKLDTNQDNYVLFDWYTSIALKVIENLKSQSDNDFFSENINESIRECLYLLDQRWDYNISLKDFGYNENLLVNFYHNHLFTLPYEGVPFILGLYYKLEALLQRQKEHVFDGVSEYDWSDLDDWFLESCQLTSIARLLENKKEEICLEIPLSIANTDPNNSEI